MKTLILALCIILNAVTIHGQIKNNSFEILNDSIISMPKNWRIKQVSGFDFTVDNDIKYSGTTSLLIKSTQEIDSNAFIPFSQIVDFDAQNFKKIAITVYIKTKDISGNAGLWCQIWDKDDKKIGFQNLQMQHTIIDGTNDWKKYSLAFVVNSNCKKLYLGGYLQGKGSVWYDDFFIENIEFASTPPSQEVKEYIDDFVQIIKENSLYSRFIDWESLNQEINLLSKGVNFTKDATAVTSHVINKLRELGDNHSFIQPKTSLEESEKTNLDGRQPYGKLLTNNIGYVYVPGFASINQNVSDTFAQSIQTIIKDLDSKNMITGWIVDLRENTGGNMHPMIAGLGPILGEGTLGHFHDAEGNVTSQWLYSNRSGSLEKVNEPYMINNSTNKVAVLIGPFTGSSGEITAISFVGRPNTKFFGQSTAGYTTSNGMFKLKDGSVLLLASSYVSDRNKKQYHGKINPDVFVDDNSDIFYVAEEWLTAK